MQYSQSTQIIYVRYTIINILDKFEIRILNYFYYTYCLRSNNYSCIMQFVVLKSACFTSFLILAFHFSAFTWQVDCGCISSEAMITSTALLSFTE